jgi:cyclic-di-GMP-binding biofilm dispersal mediator protein
VSESVSPRSFVGASVLIVGATGVLGSHIAHQLSALGARLTLSGLNETRLGELSGQLAGAVGVRADIRDASSAATLVEAAMTNGGKLDGLVIASGVVGFGELALSDPITIEELFLVNAVAPMWIMQQAIAPIALAGGFIAAISGVVAERAMPNMAAYSASKAALSSALSAVAVEAKKRNVLVLDARPPHTETGLATRPIAGVAPRMPIGLDPAAVAHRIIEGIANNETALSSASFR